SCSKAITRAQRRVMFIHFDNERSRAVFDRFAAACEAIHLLKNHGVTLEFVGVDVTDTAALRNAIQRTVDLGAVAIVAPTSPVLTMAARVTQTTPIVFYSHQDPVDLKVTSSLTQRPRNLTGISTELGIEPKMLELLREAAPRVRRIGYIFDKDEMRRSRVTEFMEASTRKHGIEWSLVPVKSIDSLRGDLLDAGPVDAWFVSKAGVLDENRELFVAIVSATRRPAVYPSQADVAVGAPLAYEAVFDDPYGALARELDRVLAGVTPSDIPLERPKRFRLSVNVKAAQAAGMTVSAELLSQADKVR
ncbi:MAG: ABC transporter substrate binding protein, partial [Usitatibacter sp.]